MGGKTKLETSITVGNINCGWKHQLELKTEITTGKVSGICGRDGHFENGVLSTLAL